jgi:hypothetical protein
MYVLAINQSVKTFPYSIKELRKSHSFSATPSDELLALFNVFPVVDVAAQYNPITQVATSNGCAYNMDKSRWETTWLIRDKTQEELDEEEQIYLTKLEAKRAEAYRTESDPLFFKAQRGEATQQEWLDKVAEIKARYVQG